MANPAYIPLDRLQPGAAGQPIVTANGVAGWGTAPVAPGDSFVALTYATTMTPNATAAKIQKIVATDNVAFTIANPTNAAAGQQLIVDILNSSGGALGTITWGNAFLLAGAFTKPADTKRRTIKFYFDGVSWVEVARAAADI